MDLIQFRRDTLANWNSINPILMEGEVGFVTDNPNRFKLGNGEDTWSLLPWHGWSGTIAQDTGQDTNAVMSQKVVTDELAERVCLGTQSATGELPESISANKALKDMDGNKIIETYASFKNKIASLGEVDLTGDTTYLVGELKTVNGRLFRCKTKFLAGNEMVLDTYFESVDAYTAFINGKFYVN